MPHPPGTDWGSGSSAAGSAEASQRWVATRSCRSLISANKVINVGWCEIRAQCRLKLLRISSATNNTERVLINTMVSGELHRINNGKTGNQNGFAEIY